MSGLLERVSAVATAAEAVDGAAPLDEATWLWLRSGPGEGESASVDETGFLLRRGPEVHLVVHPDHRGRGLGARHLAGVDGAAQAWSHGNHPAATRLAARFGFDRVRDLWVMRRPMSEPLPPGAGVGIRTFVPGDEAELLRVNAAAFAAHPEQGALDPAGLAARMAEPWFDPAGLLVATDGARMLGFHWTKQHSPELGEVYVVGIDPAAQGRGLGGALTLAGLHHLAGLGVSETILYVEADNHVARSTYARLGFTHAEADTHVLYRRGA